MTQEQIRDYDRMAKLFDQRLGLYARQSINEALVQASLKGNETVLDACCGGGELLQDIALAEHHGTLMGIDFSDAMLNVAKSRLRSYPKIILKRSEITKIDTPKNYFDVIFNTNAFHYLEHPDQVLSEFHRVLRPNGRLFLVDLAANSPLTRLWIFLRRFIRPQYSRVYAPDEMSKLLKKNKFIVLRKKLWRVNLLWSIMLFEAAPQQGVSA